jgi:hypothetical protein
MSFKFQGSGHVWDPENNRLLCSFVNGEVVVETEREAEVIRKSGFKEVPEPLASIEQGSPVSLTETEDLPKEPIQHANLRLDLYVPKAPRAPKGEPK